MPEYVPMPKLGFDMAEGRLVRKVVQEGQPIKKGEILAEVETDKATVEVEAYTTGTVVAWLVDENQFVPIGTHMVVIAAPGERLMWRQLNPKSQNCGERSRTIPNPNQIQTSNSNFQQASTQLQSLFANLTYRATHE